jgi:hypothetical protein
MAVVSASPRPGNRLAWGALVSSLALLALRLHVARTTGYGDAEALYASYALHPQPAYLDHPGLIGSIARLIGGGGPPRPELAHFVTAVAATLTPWLGGLAARAAGATRSGALATVLALSWVPELAIGLGALSPDLPLAILWLAALGLGALALRAPADSFRALFATLGAAFAAGLACLAKASGVLLVVALFAALLTKANRRRFLTLAPWGALAVIAALVAPVVVWEAHTGYPMLVHRFVTSQTGAGLSWRNLGAFVGGQLAYVTPPFLFAAVVLGVDLFRRRREEPTFELLGMATVIPALPLAALCLWSRVAEPHWFAPTYLGLAVFLSRSVALGPRVKAASLVTGAVVALVAWGWVATDLPVRVMGSSYRARYDLSNDLYAWGPGGRMLERAVARATLDSGRVPVVVGPHWVVCAQAQVQLGSRVSVGCNTPRRDDFDRWLPRAVWSDAPSVVYVTDSRFDANPEKDLPGHAVRSVTSVEVRRGGKVVRTVWATHLEKVVDVGLTSGSESGWSRR